MEFAGKKALVCGMARSGQSAARLLCKLGAGVTAQDLKEPDKIEWTFLPEEENIQLYLGKNPDDIVTLFDLIVISPGIPCNLPFVEKARKHNIPVISELELAYEICPCPIAAITGTNGKTTVTTLVGEILRKHNPNTLVAGNIGVPFTESVLSLTKDSLAVVEVSSFQLETAYNFRPSVSAVLNITPDHLDRHKNMENYRAIKEKIFQNQNENDFAVLNYDDTVCRAMKPPCKAVYFSVKEKLSEGLFLDGDRMRVRLNGIDETVADISKINILPENALAAAAISICAQTIPSQAAPSQTAPSRAALSAIAESLYDFEGVEHRIEYVGTYNGVAYYNDSKATNTDSAVKALEAMRRPVVLIGGGYDKQASFDDWVKAFDGKVKNLIVMGQTADKIVETCRAFNFDNCERVNSLRDAVTLAAARAARGDCVLLSPACASWDMFDNYEQRGCLFKNFVQEGEKENGP